MPNLTKLKADLARLKVEKDLRIKDETRAMHKGVLLSRLTRISGLFDTDGWSALMELMTEQKEALVDELSAEQPIDDRDLQLLRTELVQVVKLLELDKTISNRIDLAQQELKELAAKLAEGQGSGGSQQGGK